MPRGQAVPLGPGLQATTGERGEGKGDGSTGHGRMFVAAAAASGEIGIGRDEETEGRP
jgi:hypothetical protein